MTLTKQKLIKSICKKSGFSQSRSRELADTTLEVIKQTLVSGEDLLISGFGKFYVKEEGTGQKKNNGTENELIFGAERIICFTSSKVLRKKIN